MDIEGRFGLTFVSQNGSVQKNLIAQNGSLHLLSFLLPLYIFGQIMTFILIYVKYVSHFVAAQSSYSSTSSLFCFCFVMEVIWFDNFQTSRTTCLLG